MAHLFRHLQDGYTEHGGPARLKNGRASNPASTTTGRSIDSTPIPIGIPLKRKRGGGNLNDRFDRMMDSVNMISRSSTAPTSSSKRRKRESTSGSSSDPPAPETPRTLGRDFSMIKLQGDGSSSMLSEDTSASTIAASMPPWLTHTLSGLQPQHPLRRLLPGLNKPDPPGLKSPPAAPADETPFAFLPPSQPSTPRTPRVVSPVDPEDHGPTNNDLFTPQGIPAGPDYPDNLTATVPDPSYLYPGEPARQADAYPEGFAADPPLQSPDLPNITLADSNIYEADPGLAHSQADADTDTEYHTLQFSHTQPAANYDQQYSEGAAATGADAYNPQPPPTADWLALPVTPVIAPYGASSLLQGPPILLEDDEDVFAFSSSPGRPLPFDRAQSPPSSLPLPPSSHRFGTPIPARYSQPTPAASPHIRRGSTLSIASFVSPSERRTHSPALVDLSQLDFRWTPGPTFRPQRAPPSSPPVPLYPDILETHLPPDGHGHHERLGLLDAPVAPKYYEQSTSHEPSSSPSSNDLAAHVRRLQRVLQSSEAGSPARDPSSAGPSALGGDEYVVGDVDDEWEVVTPRRYEAGPSYGPGAPQRRRGVAPRVATPEPPASAFAPAPGIYISPLRGATDADDDEDVSQMEMGDSGRDVIHAEPVEEYSQRTRSRGSEHDSIESWSG